MTSGTTGKPKAIACPTVAYAVAVHAREATLPYARGGADGDADGDADADADADGDGAREVEGCNVMFVWEALRPLCYGHVALVVPDDVIVDTARLAAYLAEHRATRLLSTPSLLATLLETAADAASAGDAPLNAALGRMRTWLLCGEVVPAGLAAAAARQLPRLRLVNDYSSWEGLSVIHI